MFCRRLAGLVMAVVVATGWAAAAPAAPIVVGSGTNLADVWVQFADGALFEFDVYFGEAPADTTTGLGLLDVIEQETSLVTVRQDFGFGAFIDGISYAGHSDIGFGGGDNWWHYWTRETGEALWTSPAQGAADRIVSDGDSDGWVYGLASPPGVPEPASLLPLAAGLAFVRRRGR